MYDIANIYGRSIILHAKFNIPSYTPFTQIRNENYPLVVGTWQLSNFNLVYLAFQLYKLMQKQMLDIRLYIDVNHTFTRTREAWYVPLSGNISLALTRVVFTLTQTT